jgi:hypothetical protein
MSNNDIVADNTARCKNCVFNPFVSRGSNDICTLMDVEYEYYSKMQVEWFCAYYESKNEYPY